MFSNHIGIYKTFDTCYTDDGLHKSDWGSIGMTTIHMGEYPIPYTAAYAIKIAHIEVQPLRIRCFG